MLVQLVTLNILSLHISNHFLYYPDSFYVFQGNLMYTLAAKIKPQIADRLELLTDYIVTDKLKNEPQLVAALEFLLKHAGEALNEEELKKYSGVGVEVTIEEIDDCVKKAIEKYKEELLTNRYRFNSSRILGEFLDYISFKIYLLITIKYLL